MAYLLNNDTKVAPLSCLNFRVFMDEKKNSLPLVVKYYFRQESTFSFDGKYHDSIAFISSLR